MGQCETCTKELQYNAIDSDDMFTKLQSTEIGTDIQKLRADNRDTIANFKFTPMPDKSFYKGKLNDTKRDGYGENYADCFNYFGFYKNDLPQGLGAIITEQQCVYGQFQNGLLHGKAKEWTQGVTFQGTFKKGERVEGRFVTDQVTYTGKFLNDLYHGQGTLVFKNGATYTGNFEQGKFHGQGELTLESGSKYKGSFKNGLYDGYGQYKWPNGNFYRGQYHEGKRQGFGTLKIGNITYEGNWKNGDREGHGILNHEQQFGFGTWHNNILTEQ